MTVFDAHEITAAILSGGAGTRLDGRDKGLEMLGGKPLVAHVLAALRGQAGHVLICANRNCERYAQFAPAYEDAAADFAGPLAGICMAFAHCRTSWLLTLPVDCPDPPSDLARRLRSSAGDAPAAVVCAQRREPLFALYRSDLAASATAALARNEPVWRWQEQIGATGVDFTDAREAFANLNTPADFQHWERTRHG
jgi:molybdenum cofactor guanylyltransferase